MGIPFDSKINLSGNFDSAFHMISADSLIVNAYANRSELKISKDNEQTARLQKINVSKNDVPNLQFIFQYGFRNGFIPNLDALRGNFAAGINLRYPLYDGNKKEAMVQEAEALLQSSQSNTNEIELSIKTEILKILSDMNSINEQLQNTKVQIQHAEKSLERSELQYKEGTIRNLDLLDAQTNLSEAKFAELQLIYKNIMTNYALQKAAGKKLWE